MSKGISRRDFLDGIAIGSGLSMLSPLQLLGATVDSERSYPKIADNYPPALTGMRGSHKGSFEVAHALAWRGEKPERYESTGEHYDLVVVGAGMSGLAAAWYYRQKVGNDARILLLDNHDDFGGHAKRNEFHRGGRMVLGIGGAQNLENPGNYSEAATDLLNALGLTLDYLERMAENTPDNFVLGGNLGADMGLALPTATGHKTVVGPWLGYYLGQEGYDSAVRQLPISDAEQDRLISFLGGRDDYLEDMSLFEMYDYIKSASYNQFLLDRVKLSQLSIDILNTRLRMFSGISGWHFTVLEAFSYGAPGLRAMGRLGNLAGSVLASMVDDAVDIRIFPDGNASVARLLVHSLIPDVAPNMNGVDDVAIAEFDYGALDKNDQNTRLRLSSTVVGVRESTGNQVEIDYVQHGAAMRATAEHCVLACYNGLIPFLCPQLPEAQKEALGYGVKVPFVYANVLLRDGQAFSKLNASLIECPMDTFLWVSVAPPVSTAGYQPPRSPSDPMAVFMMSAPTPPGKSSATARDMTRAGRHQIYSTAFADYEADIRRQLQSILGLHGFDHETDIIAITVNRLPHGYAYEYLALHDPDWPEGQAPNEIGRAQFGRISIANSDSEARAYMDAAFDAAWRAVNEQTQ